MSELLTDDDLLTSFLLREYSIDADLVLLLQSVKARKEEILKLEDYVHIIVPGYSDENFRRHFRLRRGTVEILAQMIGNCPEIPSPNQGPGRPPIPVHAISKPGAWKTTNSCSCTSSSYSVVFRSQRPLL